MPNTQRATFVSFALTCIIYLALAVSMGTSWPQSCPRSCACGVKSSSMAHMEHKTVNCEGERLTAPPSDILNDTESLLLAANRIPPQSLGALARYDNLSEINLAQNHIYGLGDIGIMLPSLRYLALDGNEIDYFGNKTFWWATNLQVLSVRANKIEMIHADAFIGLTRLRDLDVGDNRLFAVVQAWFRDMANLVNLNLGQNNIHVLRENGFYYLPALKSLDLSHNQLQHLYDKAFVGLDALDRLSLLGNDLKAIPLSALQKIRNLKELNFNNNPLDRLDTNAIGDMNLTYLSLSYLDHLHFIDRHSFFNLSHLATLEISHNKRLNYIDPQSFQHMNQLRTLLMEHNSLSVIEERFVSSLPSLRTLHIAGNNLVCDCNLLWFIDEHRDHQMNLSLTAARSIVCSAPSSLQDKSMDQIDISKIPRTCAPRILPIFAQDHHIDLGDPLRLDCRAVGKPTPQTDWLLPESNNGQDTMVLLKARRLNGTESHRVADHITISAAGTVVVEYAQGTDSGDYTCLATNPSGRDERTAHLRVKTNLASVIVMRIVQTSITITWRSTSFTHQYQILYRKYQSNETYHSTKIEPYMRSFTANSLTPDTNYQFCIAMQQGPNTVRINCTTVRTTKQDDDDGGLFHARKYIIGGAVSCFVVIVVLIYTVTYFVQRYNKRKREEEELYSDNLSQLFLASMDSMSDTTPITYENRGAEMFDDDDIEEIRNTASMPGCSMHTTVIT